MKVNIKQIDGNWALGLAMDKHSIRSIPIGYDEWGHMRFDTERTEVGESLFRLKYRDDWSQVGPLAQCLADSAFPHFDDVGFIVPMAASTLRARQPVTEIAQELSRIVGKPCFEDLLLKAPGGISLKNLNSKEDKIAAIGNSFSVNDTIDNDGCWNVLIIDDLYHTGASMEAACAVLNDYTKVRNIYVAALTWR
ncbi:ComF family protein [Klebsiella variicola]|uniref:ComF family protein n=1 Tax=Klebsiella variicola TaxID=244366 RepID=UPI000D74D660|nr:ComF family protein [Klebsiella variicola]HBS2861771.1 ComF family protein [Klebsiella variicola subsp. variicola]ELA2960325.1 ComF family protein [Klebsiella variicola]PXL49538.1 amidophosphoribosyltransferase [Klebsiella variicola]WAT52047.1 ComF family protein [Klebsiella variicola]WAT54163.1 ComF family protein [Klebsiella variicola]